MARAISLYVLFILSLLNKNENGFFLLRLSQALSFFYWRNVSFNSKWVFRCSSTSQSTYYKEKTCSHIAQWRGERASEFAIHNTQNNKIIKPSLLTRSLGLYSFHPLASAHFRFIYLFLLLVARIFLAYQVFNGSRKDPSKSIYRLCFYLPHFVSHAIRARVNMFHMRFIMFSCTKSNLQLKKQCIVWWV